MLHQLQQPVQPHALSGGNRYLIFTGGDIQGADQVGFVVAPDHRGARGQLGGEPLYHGHVGLALRVAGVDDMNQQAGISQLFQGGLKRLHQMVGQFGDKAHRVGENHLQGIADRQKAAGGIQGVKKAVVGWNAGAGEGI